MQETDELAVRYLPLVRGVLARMHIPFTPVFDYEEAIAWGTIGLVRAARQYDPARGVIFSTYAWPRIQFAITDALRKQTHYRRVTHESPNEASLDDLMERGWDAPDAEEYPARRLDLQRALDGIPERERKVLLLRYDRDQTNATIAGAMGVSETRVQQLIQRGLERLREHLGSYEAEVA